ncbi:DUF58 domain-containing protein [Pontibacter chinhatensis]|uniref:DUF58 domain-containing protein n=1 Tax=Pontibacter chinhatensis TaxID=1436961 RepID=A0A1I2MG27_9BACT|nr:DUF58 domain-containing protein [Pontibacter chinhatensis]SFF89948.1 Protein of unknown function DUF58 [Pontibacter chinhatensis]
MKELVKKLRKYEIRIRKAINTQMHGDFHSVFKGTGLEFDDVRAYQYGDDVRSIDWNVSAKGLGTYVKTYREEKEQSVFLMLDVSASQRIGTGEQQKLDVGKEICGVLGLSAARQHSQIGIICFSDKKEKYLKPAKGIQQAYAIIKALSELEPKSNKTNLAAGIKLTLDIIKRRSIILLLSDFIDTAYEKELSMLARHHDLIVLHLRDVREQQLPPMGIIPILDKETGRTLWLNTSGEEFRKRYLAQYQENQEQLVRICQKYQANYLAINTNEDYVPQLVNLFRLRNKSIKKSA